VKLFKRAATLFLLFFLVLNLFLPGLKLPKIVESAPPRPLILIPGTMGTKIIATANFTTAEGQSFVTGEEIWGTVPQVDQKEYYALEFQASSITVSPKYPTAAATSAGNWGSIPWVDIVDPVVGDTVEVYRPFRLYFEQQGYVLGQNLFIYGWDWRWGAGQKSGNSYVNVTNLSALIDHARSLNGNSKVDIVAHSQGGYVAWLYAASAQGKALGSGSKVENLITVGTPFLGSPKATASFLFGVNYGKSIMVGNVGPSDSTVKRILTNMPGPAELLPRDPYPQYFQRDWAGDYLTRPSNLEVLDLIVAERQNYANINYYVAPFHRDFSALLQGGVATGIKSAIIAGSGLPTWEKIRWQYGTSKPIMIDGTGDETVPSISHMAENVINSSVKRYFTSQQEHLRSVQGFTVSLLPSALIAARTIINGGTPVGVDISLNTPFALGQWVKMYLRSPMDMHVYAGSDHTGYVENGQAIEQNVPLSFFENMGEYNEQNIAVGVSTGNFELKLDQQPGASGGFELAVVKTNNGNISEMYVYSAPVQSTVSLFWTGAGVPTLGGYYPFSTHTQDYDGDGLSNAEEYFFYDSDASDSDTDNDTLSDFVEARTWKSSLQSNHSDSDACSDRIETGNNETIGGKRDPINGGDFFDVSGDNSIDLSDTLEILNHFGQGPTSPGYDQKYDRASYDSSKPWKTSYTDDGIDLTDALNNLAGFGHSCN